ncbi:MAG: replication initiation factor, partial [Dehalococcoidales bacterium]
MGRIYDKGFEIKHSDKSWFNDIWKAGGHDGVSAVTRIEGQFRRPFLKEMNVNTYPELIQRNPDIWRVFTSEFISLRTPDIND